MNRIIHIFRKPLKKLYYKLVEYRKYAAKYYVEGKVQNKKKMLYVLAGYKPYLWDDVFSRIKKYQPNDMEVCIGSSGKYCEELSGICKANGWVYVSTKPNNVCVISNLILRLFMMYAYIRINKEFQGSLGYICPTLPLGFYGMHDFLTENNCLKEYEKMFGAHKIGGYELNPSFRLHNGVDEFIWKQIGIFDKKAVEYQCKDFQYEVCGTRTGIAAILFERKFWDEMGGLKRPFMGIGVGDEGDEGQITSFCSLHFKMMVCVKNILVGHFSFGGAEQNMLKFKEQHPEIFELHEDI